MAYQRTTWASGDAITSVKLNNIESGIAGLESEIAAATQDVYDKVMTINGLVSPFELHRGYAGDNDNAGKWVQINDAYQHIVIPIKAGDTLEIEAAVRDGAVKPIMCGFLRAYTAPATTGDDVYFANSTTKFSANANTPHRAFVAPSESGYLYVQIIQNGEDRTPKSLKINGVEYARESAPVVTGELNNGIDEANILPFGARREYLGNIAVNGTWETVNSLYRFKVVPCDAGAAVTVKAGSDNPARIGIVTEHPKPSNADSAHLSADPNWSVPIVINADGEYSGTAPEDAAYLVVMTTYNNVNCAPASVKVGDVEYVGATVYDNLKTYSDRLTAAEDRMAGMVTEDTNGLIITQA